MAIIDSVTIPDAIERAALELMLCGDFFDKFATQGIEHYSHSSMYMYMRNPCLNRFASNIFLTSNLFGEFFDFALPIGLDSVKRDLQINGSAVIENYPHPTIRLFHQYKGGGLCCHISEDICDMKWAHTHLFFGAELLICLADRLKCIGHLSMQIDTLFVEKVECLSSILEYTGERNYYSGTHISSIKRRALGDRQVTGLLEKYMNCDV